jgi:hypothetical protein
MPLPLPPEAAGLLFSRLASTFSVEEDGGPAQRGIMDLRNTGTRRRGAAAPSLLLLLPTLPFLLPTLPPPPADDGFNDDGRGGCQRGCTGMINGFFPCLILWKR